VSEWWGVWRPAYVESEAGASEEVKERVRARKEKVWVRKEKVTVRNEKVGDRAKTVG